MKHYNSKCYKFFWNITVQENLRKFLRKQAKTLTELDINSYGDLCRAMNIRAKEHGSTAIGKLSLNLRNQEALHLLFDEHDDERRQLRNELERLREEQRRLKNRKIGDLNFHTYKDHFQTISDIDAAITTVQAKLDSTPKRNGVTGDLFTHPFEDDLIRRKWIRRASDDSLKLTPKGEKILDEQDRLWAMFSGIVLAGQTPSEELVEDSWKALIKVIK
jgi:hypothetical protein